MKADFDCIVVVAHADYLDTTAECLEAIESVGVEQTVFVMVNGLTAEKMADDQPFWDLFRRFDHERLFVCPTVPHERAYELGALKSWLEAANITARNIGWMPFKRVLLLQDTCIVHSREFFDKMFAPAGSTSMNDVYQNYCMVYEIPVLMRMAIPEVTTKEQSVRYEGEFNKAYAVAAGHVTAIWPSIRDRTATVQKWGRENRTMGVDGVFTKYKGCWSASMIRDAR